jgi:hypothetical protein
VNFLYAERAKLDFAVKEAKIRCGESREDVVVLNEGVHFQL